MANNFQEQVRDFVTRFNLESDPQTRLLDLLSELGEVAKEILKSSSYGKKSFVPDENWKSELGDLFFSLTCLANQTGVDLESALRVVLSKYQERIEKKGDAGSGR